MELVSRKRLEALIKVTEVVLGAINAMYMVHKQGLFKSD
jgi:hypothetical protein